MTGSVVVTGAAGGIGRAITATLATHGLTVVAVDMSPALAELEGVVPVQVDLTTDEGVAKVRESVEGHETPLVGLVNNAGITRDARLVNMGDDDFRKVISLVGLNGAALARIGPAAQRIAEAEGLFAHAAAVRARLEPEREDGEQGHTKP